MRHISRHLTPREAEIARLAIRGISTKDIAMRLGLKHGTVKIHLHSIYEKLDVDGRLGLILIGRRHGLA
jgi:DNA-binding CsgD family transcriptional regulator